MRILAKRGLRGPGPSSCIIWHSKVAALILENVRGTDLDGGLEYYGGFNNDASRPSITKGLENINEQGKQHTE